MKKVLVMAVLALPLIGGISLAADFNGDGTGDITIFRASSGLWSVRGITRVYFGGTGDSPVPGDYDGSGIDRATIFRASSGLWASRGVTRVYFGGSSDEPNPGDCNGDGTEEFCIFRASSGLWAVRGITRAYYGTSGDVAIPPDVAHGVAGGPVLTVTGQTAQYDNYDDGYYEKGASFNLLVTSSGGDWITKDRHTGLMWASNGSAEGCNWGQQSKWPEAVAYCHNLTFGGYTDWRLPNIRELHSIVDFGVEDPATKSAYFPNTKPDYYWSSTTRKSWTYNAWTVKFDEGSVEAMAKECDSCYFRAVRGGL